MRTAALLLILSVVTPGSDSKPTAIWPKGAPGETTALEERDTTTEKSPLVAGRRLMRLSDISNPTITVYSPTKEKNTAPRFWSSPAEDTTSWPTTWKEPRCANG